MTEGRGADAVLEVVGSPAATRTAVDLVRPGGVVASVGVHTEEHLAFAPAEAYDRNLTYRTGRCPARHYMERLLPLLAEGRFPVGKVISHRLPLEDGASGLRALRRPAGRLHQGRPPPLSPASARLRNYARHSSADASRLAAWLVGYSGPSPDRVSRPG